MKTPISRAIQVHRRYAKKGGIEHAFGDGYLCEKNGVYRAIRDLVIQLDFKFTLQDFCHYHACSNVSLPSMMELKRIPYKRSTEAMIAMSRFSGGRLAIQHIPTERFKNSVFHESCHGIANYYLEKSVFDSLRGFSSQEKTVLRVLMAESFANTVEILGNLHLSQEMDYFFYRCNSFWSQNLKENRRSLSKYAKFFGNQVLIRAIYFFNLHSHFLYNYLDQSDLRRIFTVLGSSQKHADSIQARKLSSMVLKQLSLGFRTQTASFYMTYAEGLRTKDIFELTQFKFMNAFSHPSALFKALDELLSVALAGSSVSDSSSQRKRKISC